MSMDLARMRIFNEDTVRLASLSPEDSGIVTNSSTLCTTSDESDRIFGIYVVTHSFPSPIISCVESMPQDAHISHLELTASEDGSSVPCNEASTSKSLRDVHIVRTQVLKI